ncbi:MAG TPA: hypothetical protein VFO26_13765 [Gaiella sp.]|uniref:hypothetical protein n=1 Tax=Gaiella sp. TaxID=2663207 RepID=UPI002D7EF542|nr:hypothetical protein [Gaiella sp.]HET9288618.1 hypothetical protein [Gaiella sp.]
MPGRSWTQIGASIALAVAVIGVFCTWTKEGPVSLNGTQGPHDGWLVVILAVPALLWARSMARGSWVGVVGVLGTALVIGWTALTSWRDSREVLGASVGYGLLLVVAASLGLSAVGVASGLELLRARNRPRPGSS